MLVTFSGMDGAGKTTQIDILIKSLRKEGIAVQYFWSRGGYTPGFNFIKKILRLLLKKKLAPVGRSQRRQQALSKRSVSRAWLNFAIFDLIIFYGIFIRFKKIFNGVVICDRYLDDTELDFKLNFPNSGFEGFLLWKILNLITPKPDISFLFILPVEIAQQRSALKNEPFPDDETVLKKRLNAYLDTIFFSPEIYVKIDGMQGIDETADKIKSCLEEIKDG